MRKGPRRLLVVLLCLSRMNRYTIKRKLENLKELGFTDEKARILVKRFPTLLGLSEDKLQQNPKFLLEEWKLPRNAILRDPTALGYSTEKRLRPRLNALRALTMKNNSRKKAESYFSGRYIMSNKNFHCKVVGRLKA